MSSVQNLKQFVNDRLAAAAEEIFGVFQLTVSELENELKRQRELLDVFRNQPVVYLKTKDQQLQVTEQEDYLEQDCRASLDREEPEHPHNEDEKQVDVKLVQVKHEDEDEDQREQESSTSSLIQHIKTEANKDYCGESDPELHVLPQPDHQMSSESDTDDSEDWRETNNTTVGSNTEDNLKVLVSEDDTKNKSFTCSKCGEICASSTGLTIHTNSCSGLVTCKTCGKCFSAQKSLDEHMKYHSGVKPFCCSYCGKCFTQKGCLIKHMRIHTGEKPFGCTYCGKRFTHKGALIDHMRIHTGEKPFACSYCGKCFRQQGALIDHVRIHTGEKPFSCSFCDKAFTQRSNLQRHIRTHNR